MERQPGRRGFGRGATWTGVVVAVLAGACFAARPADPRLADPPTVDARAGWARMLATDVTVSLTRLLEILGPALEHGRRGTARTVDGDEAPQPEYLAAVDVLEAATGEADAAAIAVARLQGVLAGLGTAAGVGLLGASGADLAGIAGQLRQAAVAAGLFVELRRAAEATVAELGEALAAVDDDDLPAAMSALDRASVARAIVAGWEDAPVTLPFWLETSGDLIDALGRLVSATAAGDAVAAAAAAADYADASDEAHQADLALAISISEAGSAIARTPLRRLTAVVSAVITARFAAAAVALPS